MSDLEFLADTPEDAPRARLGRSGVRPPRAVEIRKIRSSHTYRSAVEKFRKTCSQKRNKDGSRGAACWLCGQDINYSVKFPHPGSFSVDHSIPVNDRPDLIMDTTLWMPSHFSCNSARGGMDDDLYGPNALGVSSEDW